MKTLTLLFILFAVITAGLAGFNAMAGDAVAAVIWTLACLSYCISIAMRIRAAQRRSAQPKDAA